MSRWQGFVSSASLTTGSLAVALAVHCPVGAQVLDAEAANGDDAQCRRQREAAMISGEIVVCARRGEGDEFRIRSGDEAQSAYAEATMNRGLGRKPDFRPPQCKPSLLTFCPKFGGAPPRAVEVDFAKLPAAPPGSDAARLNEPDRRP